MQAAPVESAETSASTPPALAEIVNSSPTAPEGSGSKGDDNQEPPPPPASQTKPSTKKVRKLLSRQDFHIVYLRCF